MPEYQFAISKTILRNGKETLVPLVRQRSRFFKKPWNRIIQLYGRFILQDIESVEISLTTEQCMEHIEGFKAELLKEKENQIVKKELTSFPSLKI